MRVTAATKAETRQRILDASLSLFRSGGFEATTTRDIAREAGIATGTLFNYFPTKEAIVMELVSASLEKAGEQFPKRRRNDASLEEDLFLYVSTGLRQLKAIRTFVGPALETGFNPARQSAGDERAGDLRAGHLATVAGLLAEHGVTAPPSAMELQMYWMLYTGVLTHWATDASPKQEDTLAVLDQAIHMFVSWIHNQRKNPT